MNLEDPRFGALFSSPAYAIDPTDPRFAKSAAALKVASAVAKRRSQKQAEGAGPLLHAVSGMAKGRHGLGVGSGKEGQHAGRGHAKGGAPVTAQGGAAAAAQSSAPDDAELRLLVASLKRKQGQQASAGSMQIAAPQQQGGGSRGEEGRKRRKKRG